MIQEKKFCGKQDVQQSLLGQHPDPGAARYDRRNHHGTALSDGRSGGCIRLHASLRCEEMIARMQPASLKEAIE